MKLVKYIIAILLYIGTFFVCILLTGVIPVDHWGFAICVNFLFMIIFTLLFEKLFLSVFSAKYFISQPFEKEGFIYQWLGVKYYKYLLKLIGWEKIIRKNQLLKNNMDSLKKFEKWTQGSEVIHLFAAVSVIAFTIWVGWTFTISDIRWLVVSNVLFNVYPVILQRYNRPRINRLINKKLHYSE